MFQQPLGQTSIAKIPGNVAQSIKDNVKGISNSFTGFASGAVSSSRDFLFSNSILARISFIILVIIAYIIVFKLSVRFIVWLMTPSKNPYIISGLIPGSTNLVFAQDEVTDGSVPISRSNNENTGLEFTWSVWLNLTGAPSSGSYFHVFHKGDSKLPADPTSTSSLVNNGPGLYIARVANTENVSLVILMNSFDNSNPIYNITVDNIPLKKWIHVVIRMENTVMDVYINGTLTKRIIFQNTVPRQNYGKVYVCQPMGTANAGSNGFNGYLSDLRYFDHALSVFSINNITYFGPNMKPSSLLSQSNGSYGASYFFDKLWYNIRY